MCNSSAYLLYSEPSILSEYLSDALSLWPRRSRAKFEKTSLSTNVSLRSDLLFGQNTTVISIMAELLHTIVMNREWKE